MILSINFQKSSRHCRHCAACLRQRRTIGGSMRACLPVCLPPGRHVDRFLDKARVAPSIISLPALCSAPHRAQRESSILPFSTVFPSLPYPSYLSSRPFRSPRRSLIRYRSKEEESRGLWIYADSLGVPYLANKPRDSRHVRR